MIIKTSKVSNNRHYLYKKKSKEAKLLATRPSAEANNYFIGSRPLAESNRNSDAARPLAKCKSEVAYLRISFQIINILIFGVFNYEDLLIS